MFIEKMKGQDYIDKIRKYLDYLEEHLNNVAKAFQEVSEACNGMAWVGDDFTWHTLRHEVEYHDISKFSKDEFTQYRSKFFSVDDELHDTQLLDMKFDNAFDNHKVKNTHHWQSIRYDDKTPGITERDIVHMVVDWTAMGYKFGDTAEAYYNANKNDIFIKEDFIPFLTEIFDRLKSKT